MGRIQDLQKLNEPARHLAELIYIPLGTPRQKLFYAHQYLKELSLTPIVIFNATDDDISPLGEAQSLFEAAPDQKHLYAAKASGHHFEGGDTVN